MNIIFEFGERYYETSSESFWIPLVVTIIGAFTGFLLALYADRQLNKRKAILKEKEIVERKYGQLMYLKSVVTSIVEVIPKQALKFKEFSETIKSKPFEITLPTILATYDLLRLRNADNVATQDAFFTFFSDSENPYKDYKNLFAHSDYLYREFESVEAQITRATDFKHKDQLVIRDLIEEISLLLVSRGHALTETLLPEDAQKDAELIFINELAESYIQIISKMIVFSELKEFFILPIMTKSLFIFQDKEMANKIFALSRKANSRLRNIEENALLFAEDMGNFEKNIQSALEYFKQFLEKVEKIKKNEP